MTAVLWLLSEVLTLLISEMRDADAGGDGRHLVQRLVDLLQRAGQLELSCARAAELLPALFSELTRLSSVSKTLWFPRATP